MQPNVRRYGAVVKVFVSYRREDSFAGAGRVYDHLSRRFGKDNVFMDVDSIPAGADFSAVIERKISDSDVVLVIIGKGWLTVSDRHGNRRIDSVNDLVAQEVRLSLEKSSRVIPVLIDGAMMPRMEQLPAQISTLSQRHAFELRDAQFKRDIVDLLEQIGAQQMPWRMLPIAAVAFLIGLAAYIGSVGFRIGERPIAPTISKTIEKPDASDRRRLRMEMLERLKHQVDQELNTLRQEVSDPMQAGFGPRALLHLRRIHELLEEGKIPVGQFRLPPPASARGASEIALAEIQLMVELAFKEAMKSGE